MPLYIIRGHKNVIMNNILTSFVDCTVLVQPFAGTDAYFKI